jgi:uracil-DNA glycosylase
MNSAKSVHELLAFYVDAGVDAALDSEPVDRFAEKALSAANEADMRPAGEPGARSGERSRSGPVSAESRARSATSIHGGDTSGRYGRAPTIPGGGPAPGGAAPAAPDAAIMAARGAAQTAQTLDELRALLENFEGCMLRATATQLVFAAGNPQARVMFVGEAPGRDEDIEGEPFVGRSGKLLDLMMRAIGLDRSASYIANVVPWRPPGNRTPTPQETAICLPFIRRQIELADPDILVCLGQPATQTLLGTKEGISRSRGRWFKFDTGRREIRALATFHPAFLLRTPAQKRHAWRDFLALKKALAQ